MRPLVDLTGKKGLVVGIANDSSIAYGCASAFRACGADLAVTYLNDKAQPHVRPLAEALEALLAQLVHWRRQDPGLPRAVLHADLFRDNVLFDGHHLSGVIDFYNAASGWMLYDVAIAVNDWCLDGDGALEPRHARALLAGYAARRAFTAAEAQCWPAMLRLAALRFWLSRQIAAEEFAGQDGVLVKDPQHFARLLLQHRAVAVGLPLAL